MSEILGVSFPLSAIAIMIVFMVLMMGICFLMMRIGRMRMGCMGGCCRCMEMIHPGAGEKRS